MAATDASGNRRLDDPKDFVRLELQTALSREIPVVPVFVDGATMPRSDDLPEVLKDLSFRQGIVVRGNPDFRTDVTRLVDGLVPLSGLGGLLIKPPS